MSCKFVIYNMCGKVSPFTLNEINVMYKNTKKLKNAMP